MSKSIKLILLCIALVLVTGHVQAISNEGTSTTAPQATDPAGNIIAGTVVETMNAGGYTYLCLENNGQKTWAAIRERQVNVGEEVELADGPALNNFTSKTLGRTFDAIVFSRGIVSH